MATTQTTGNVGNEMAAAFYSPILLKRLLPHLVHSQFGKTTSPSP